MKFDQFILFFTFLIYGIGKKFHEDLSKIPGFPGVLTTLAKSFLIQMTKERTPADRLLLCTDSSELEVWVQDHTSILVQVNHRLVVDIQP